MSDATLGARYRSPLIFLAAAFIFCAATFLAVTLYVQHEGNIPKREWWLLYIVGVVAPLINTGLALRRARHLGREFPTLPPQVTGELRESALRPLVVGYAVMVFALIVIRRVL